MITPLSEAGKDCGGKAFQLRRLIDAGFAVPDGVVLPDSSSDDWESDLDGALDRLGTDTFAVRSSAQDEDGEHASYAGQLHTSLQLKRADLSSAVRRSAESISAPAVQAYAETMGQSPSPVVPVIIQRMLDPEVAGVAFTRHPVTGARQVVIEAVQGLGDQLVGGALTPERWVLADGLIIPGSSPNGHLTERQVRDIAGVSRHIEELFGRAQDIEWAIDNGQLWILQGRPITYGRTDPDPFLGTHGSILLTGTPASSGAATGQVKIIRGLDDFDRLGQGDVLVCRATSPAWTPLLARAAAVVTETGGLLAHAAIVAREFGIPAVLGSEDAMTILQDDQRVVVDGTSGTVTADCEGRDPHHADTH